jgi:hypothetical protein
VTILFSVCLAASLALDAAVILAPDHARRRLRWLLAGVLLLTWVFLGLAAREIAARTASTLAVPGVSRKQDLMHSAGREALLVLGILGGPAAVATLLGVLAIRASRRRRPRPGHMERMK